MGVGSRHKDQTEWESQKTHTWVSSLPAAIAVYALVRKHVFAAYLGFALLGSMLSGLAYAAVMA